MSVYKEPEVTAEELKKSESKTDRFERKGMISLIITRYVITVVLALFCMVGSILTFLDSSSYFVYRDFSTVSLFSLIAIIMLHQFGKDLKFGNITTPVLGCLIMIGKVLIKSVIANTVIEIIREIIGLEENTLKSIALIIIVLTVIVVAAKIIINLKSVKGYYTDNEKEYFENMADTQNKLSHMRPVYEEWNYLIDVLRQADPFVISMDDALYVKDMALQRNRVYDSIVEDGETSLLDYMSGSPIFDMEESLDELRRIREDIDEAMGSKRAGQQSGYRNAGGNYSQRSVNNNNEDLIKAMGTLHIESLDGLTLEALKSEYTKLAKKFHPDEGDAETNREMQNINVAYDLLKQEIIKRNS